MQKSIKEFSDLYIDIVHNTSTDWTMTETHFHNYYELNLSVSGGNRFFINDRIHDARPGDLFCLSDRDLHKNMVPKDMFYERYMVTFKPETVLPFCEEGKDLLEVFTMDRSQFDAHLSLTSEEMLELRTLLNDTIYHSRSTYYQDRTYLKIKLIEILLAIHRFYHKGDHKQKKAVRLPDSKTAEILDYLNHHISETISLERLSEHFYMNRTYLCDLFKRETGFTINQYITNRRILRACDLLKSGHSVTEVTHAVGYSNDSHFIRTFKKLVGKTPKQYALELR